MQSLAEAYPGAIFRELAVSNRLGWYCLNPSIAKIGAQYRCVIRSSNFQVHKGNYYFSDPNNICRTDNYLAILDDNLNIASMDLIDYSKYESDLFPVRGLEDARLCVDWNFCNTDGAILVGTCRDWDASGVAKVAVCSLDGLEVYDRTFLPQFPTGAYTKNAMPIEGQGASILKCSPPVLVNHDSGYMFQALVEMVEPFVQNFRGGSQIIDVWGTRIGVIHEVDYGPNGRIYSHRFVRFDKEIINAASDPFCFLSQGIEFCAGLALKGNQLILSFGVNDDRAMLALVDVEQSLESLKSIRRA